MNKVIQYFVNRSFTVNLISAFIILSGVLMGSMIKRDIIPPFEYKMIIVRAKLPGASATEIEKFLAYPIENALQGLPHAIDINSRSTAGSMRMLVFYDAGHKTMNEAVEQIRGRINGVRWQLPEQSRDISIQQNKTESIFHMGIALENFVETNPEHRAIAKSITDSIKAVPGIIQASLLMNTQNVYVKIDPKKIAENEISISEIRSRIRQALSFSPVGKVDFDEKSFSIEIERPAEAVEALNKLAIRGNRTGDILYLNEIAEVKLEVDEIKRRNRYNGNPNLKIYTRKDITHDSIALKGTIQKLIDKKNLTLPKPLKITPFLDGPRFIEKQLGTLSNNGLFGMILVLVILTLFFNFKVALATSFGIPIAYCGTLVALYCLNISIDLISVVGMILVLGILVDDAIIIAERYMENLEKGMQPKEAATSASKDLMLPVTGTVLTTIFAFSPMIMINSEIAMVFYAIPVVIIVSLLMSWLESFFILPNHLFHFIKKPTQNEKQATLFNKTKKLYRNGLVRILKFRYVAVIALVAFMAASIWIARNKIQQNFFFSPDIERISVKFTLKESVSLAHTEKALAPIEQYLMRLPKDLFGAVETSIGDLWTHGREYKGYRYAKMNLYVSQDASHPNRIKKKYTKKLREELKKFKVDSIETIEVGHEIRGQEETKKDMVTINVSGNEDVDYLSLKNHIIKEIKDKDFKLKVVKEINEFDEKWVFAPHSEKLAQHQLNQSQLTSQLRSFFVPHELMQLRISGESKWLYTQVQRKKAVNQNELNKMTVLNAQGLSVPLKELGTWSKKKQLATIRHRNGKRLLSFDISYKPDENMNINVAKDQANVITAGLSKKFPTYEVELKDADKGETDRKAWAGKVALLCVILVMFTLALILGSITLPFIVGLPIPFGLMGIVWALYLHDMPMGMMSLVGLIGTVGVSVNDSLIMVDQIMKRGKKRGKLTRDDILEGASSRLRAIILTTVTTLGGVIPMAYGIGGESGFTQPLAFSIGWGLFFSTFLTLFALPAFIEIRRDIGGLMTRGLEKFNNRKKNYQLKDLKIPTGFPEISNGADTTKDIGGQPKKRPPEAPIN